MSEEIRISVPQLVMIWRKKYDKYQREFHSTFGVPLGKYWDKLFGFDIVKFDDWLIETYHYEDGKTSMSDFIRKVYGENGVRIIQALNTLEDKE